MCNMHHTRFKNTRTKVSARLWQGALQIKINIALPEWLICKTLLTRCGKFSCCCFCCRLFRSLHFIYRQIVSALLRGNLLLLLLLLLMVVVVLFLVLPLFICNQIINNSYYISFDSAEHNGRCFLYSWLMRDLIRCNTVRIWGLRGLTNNALIKQPKNKGVWIKLFSISNSKIKSKK